MFMLGSKGSFGVIHAGDDAIFSDGLVVKYNPYDNETFVCGGAPIHHAGIVYINENGVFASGL